MAITPAAASGPEETARTLAASEVNVQSRCRSQVCCRCCHTRCPAQGMITYVSAAASILGTWCECCTSPAHLLQRDLLYHDPLLQHLQHQPCRGRHCPRGCNETTAAAGAGLCSCGVVVGWLGAAHAAWGRHGCCCGRLALFLCMQVQGRSGCGYPALLRCCCGFRSLRWLCVHIALGTDVDIAASGLRYWYHWWVDTAQCSHSDHQVRV